MPMLRADVPMDEGAESAALASWRRRRSDES
jgi:hypothetical protein